MTGLLHGYVRAVDGMNRRIGRVVMFAIFALMAVLLWSVASKAAGIPSLWTLETAQFVMVGYYILGGPYAIQMGSNVRMDLFYGDWSVRRKAAVDAVTVLFLMAFLAVLLWGGLSSLAYALGHFQGDVPGFFGGLVRALAAGGPTAAAAEIGHLERSATAWRPVMWPIKLVMVVGIALMLLQALSELARDVLVLRGDPHAPRHPGEAV